MLSFRQKILLAYLGVFLVFLTLLFPFASRSATQITVRAMENRANNLIQKISLAPDEVTTRRQGVVRDFIKFVPHFPAWVPRLGGKEIWPWVFNVADAALVCGVCILLIHTWWDRKPAPSVA